MSLEHVFLFAFWPFVRFSPYACSVSKAYFCSVLFGSVRPVLHFLGKVIGTIPVTPPPAGRREEPTMTTFNAASFARDASERAVKTLIQTGAVFGIAEITNVTNSIQGGDLPNEFAIFGPIILAALSVATSWLSRFRGDPNSASGSKV